MWKRLLMLGLVGVTVGALAEEVESEDRADGLSNSSQLGVAVTGGNSDSQTYNVQQKTKYGWQANRVSFSAHYLYGLALGVEAAKNWHAAGRYERDLSERFGVYTGPGVEGDIFAGFDERYNLDAGGKYWLWPGNKKADYAFTELGYRYSYQDNVAGTVPSFINSHFVRAYVEASHKLSESVSLSAYFEFLPDLNDMDNVLFNFEPALSVALNNILSLKFQYSGRYDGKPVAGKKKFDWHYLQRLWPFTELASSEKHNGQVIRLGRFSLLRVGHSLVREGNELAHCLRE